MFFLLPAHVGLGHDERQLGRIQVLADIADEMGQVLLVLVVEALVYPVVPTLMPAESQQFEIAAWVLREQRCRVRQHPFRQLEDLLIVRSHLIARGWWPNILRETLAAPGELD